MIFNGITLDRGSSGSDIAGAPEDMPMFFASLVSFVDKYNELSKSCKKNDNLDTNFRFSILKTYYVALSDRI